MTDHEPAETPDESVPEAEADSTPTQPVDSQPVETAAAPAAAPRWRDRVIGFRGALALGLASLVVGGLGGAAITAVAADDDGPRGHGERSHGWSSGRGPDGRAGMWPGQLPGQGPGQWPGMGPGMRYQERHDQFGGGSPQDQLNRGGPGNQASEKPSA